MTGIDRGDTLRNMLLPLRPFLDDPDVTEICLNRPNEVFTLTDRWNHYREGFSLPDLRSFATAAARYVDNDISNSSPVLSGLLPDYERVQIVSQPACEINTVSVTIRKPAQSIIPMDEYSRRGFFEPEEKDQQKLDPLLPLYDMKDKRSFIEAAIGFGKTIVVAGGTGSGKTTLLRTLLNLIPSDKRIITIEDVPELPVRQPNRVHLFSNALGPTQMFKCTMRMRPDVVILGEVRGEEAFDFVNVVQSGHGGSMTSVHAASCEAAFDRLAMLFGTSPQGGRIPDAAVRRMLREVIDVVIHLTPEKRISEVYYKDA